MNKLRCVIDTNTLISSILIEVSVPNLALQKARNTGILLFSNATFEELSQVIYRSKFDRYISVKIRAEFIVKLREDLELVSIQECINACRDPKDNKFLEVAVNGNADCLITGDQDLLILNPFRKITYIRQVDRSRK
jgi:putative PIN family toxin of toxin-antitoxin system